jgi:hypothetical protein
MACGVTNTLYGNQVAPTIMREYGEGVKGGCLCGMGAAKPMRKMTGGSADGLGGTCSGGTPMLKALGIMQGGSSTTRRRQRRRQSGGTCTTCRSYRGGKRGGGSLKCKPGAYKATAADNARLRRHLAGKSIGFTQRSSLKAKGLLRRANGSCKVSKKYQ